MSSPADPWTLAGQAAALFAVDPHGCGGVVLRTRPGPARESWLALLRALLPPLTPLRRVPLAVSDSRLLGGLDLTATLQAGRPIAERGLLAEADGGVLLLAMAERLSPTTAAHLTATLDSGELRLERDGLTLRAPARCGVVALDEGMDADERAPAALRERLAFYLELPVQATTLPADPALISAARARLPTVQSDEPVLEALCAAALALGVLSLRAPLLALRVARASAALAGRERVTDVDAALAAQLVFAHRATTLPPAEPAAAPEPTPPATEPAEADPANLTPSAAELENMMLAAAQAALPADLLAQLKLADGSRSRSPRSGRAGVVSSSSRRGRPAGVRRGALRAGARLNLIETLRAAAPWQTLRRQHASPTPAPRIRVHRDDFRITRCKQRTETTTIFVVDASGSAALHRLAEAKGAVELLLADCYVRRDSVALIAFRGRGAELLLPPTRSLVRAKRSLASLPGGGATPLAAGIDAALALADTVRRREATPVIVLLTDGRANISRDGSAGRAQAEDDALAAARQVALSGITTLLIDMAPRPQPPAARLAAALAARYLPLPYADAARLSQAIQAAV